MARERRGNGAGRQIFSPERGAGLALQLLCERDPHNEQRLGAPESIMQQVIGLSPASYIESQERFDRLASLTSFRFVGPQGRFPASRESKRGMPTRGWAAHRSIMVATPSAGLGH